jgi:hypothetical protein
MRPIVAEKLLRVQEAIEGKLCASARLQDLTKHKFSNISDPLIIFRTPEVLEYTESHLKRIVVEEFDVLKDIKKEYRAVYLELFPRI